MFRQDSQLPISMPKDSIKEEAEQDDFIVQLGFFISMRHSGSYSSMSFSIRLILTVNIATGPCPLYTQSNFLL
ncbi:hypothetical protein [Halobacillus sp. H74]|uniref:hypothetical protein n=1 Tax=Halobacillus sp. H74 TaxID=3457436 RepID=UPI003FCE4284